MRGDIGPAMPDQLGARLPGGWSLRRVPVAWHPDTTDVFCGAGARAAGIRGKALWTTEHFYLIENIRPVAASHLLVIPRWHIPSLGALPAAWAPELEAIQQKIRDYHREVFGAETLFYENDIAWQTVHHAHLHAVPLPAGVRSAPLLPGSIAAPQWGDVRSYFAGGRQRYHLIQVGRDRRLFAGGSIEAIAANGWVARTMSIQRGPAGNWQRVTDENAAVVAGERFRSWLGRNLESGRGVAA